VIKVNALIVHPYFEIIGGAEYLALQVSRVLMESGFNVEVLSATPVDVERLNRFFGNGRLPKITIKRVKTADHLSYLSPGRFVRLRKLFIYQSISHCWSRLEGSTT